MNESTKHVNFITKSTAGVVSSSRSEWGHREPRVCSNIILLDLGTNFLTRRYRTFLPSTNDNCDIVHITESWELSSCHHWRFGNFYKLGFACHHCSLEHTVLGFLGKKLKKVECDLYGELSTVLGAQCMYLHKIG